jgi:hypothetical protein
MEKNAENLAPAAFRSAAILVQTIHRQQGQGGDFSALKTKGGAEA